MENIILAITLGIVEGLTEFLPVSSTGHLILATDLLHRNQEDYASFNIIIQLGAILAVVFLYKERFISFLDYKKIINYKDTINENSLNLFHIIIAIIPVLIIGFVSRKYIKAHLYNPTTVVTSLIIVGVIMIVVEKIKPEATKRSVDKITYKDAFIIGLAQCFALIPGVSRSGATMLMSMQRKIDVKSSADFSFLISVPVITLATVYELLKSFQILKQTQVLELFIGFIVSFFVAIIAIKGFLYILKRLSLTPFAIYRIVVGVLYIWLK